MTQTSASSAPLGVATLTLGAFVVFLNLGAPLLLCAGIALVLTGPVLTLRPPTDRRRWIIAGVALAALCQAADSALGFWGDLAATERFLDGLGVQPATFAPIDRARQAARGLLLVLSAALLAHALIHAKKKKGPEFPPSPRSDSN